MTSAVRYREEKLQLLQLGRSHPTLDLPIDLEEPRDDESARACRGVLDGLRPRLEEARRVHGCSVTELVGLDVSTLDGARIDEISNQAVRAEATLAPQQLARLSQLVLMGEISKFSDEDASTAEVLCGGVERESQAFVVQEASIEAKARRRLYAEVMRWHRETSPGALCPATCPVCSTPLASVENDPVLGVPIQEALREAVSAGVETRLTAQAWAREAEQRLVSALPASVATLMARTLPSSPHEAYRTAICDDLLADPEFGGVLQPLVSRARARWAELQTRLPPFEEAQKTEPPAHLSPFASALFARVNRIRHLLALRAWRRSHESEAREALFAMVRAGTEAAPSWQTIPDELRVLRASLGALKPVADGIEIAARTRRALEEWCAVQERIHDTERCAEAVSGLSALSELVQGQVGNLMVALNDRTLHWLDMAYGHPTENRPKLLRIEREAGAALRAVASYHGVSGPAEGITNASAQRAYLWAFSIALWEQLRDNGAALSLLLLDDPQTLFDDGNTQRLATAIATLAAEGARPIVVTSNRGLYDHMQARAEERSVSTCSLELMPRSHGQAMADLRIDESGLTDRRRRWRAAKDDDDRIQAFVGAVRVHLEARVFEMLDHGAARPKSRTLQPLLDEVRRLHGAGIAPYRESVFAQLAGHPALRPGSPFREAINEAHHGAGRRLVTADAVVVDKELTGVLNAVRNCQEAWCAT